MSEWQPIESAPKDGTEVLLYWPRYAYNLAEVGEPRVLIGYWKTNGRLQQVRRSELEENGISISYFADTDELDDFGLATAFGVPSHWMPLPLPPSS